GEAGHCDFTPPVPVAFLVPFGVCIFTAFDRVIDDHQFGWSTGERRAYTSGEYSAFVAFEDPFGLGCHIVADLQVQLVAVLLNVVADGSAPTARSVAVVRTDRDSNFGVLHERPRSVSAYGTLRFPHLRAHGDHET